MALVRICRSQEGAFHKRQESISRTVIETQEDQVGFCKGHRLGKAIIQQLEGNLETRWPALSSYYITQYPRHSVQSNAILPTARLYSMQLMTV